MSTEIEFVDGMIVKAPRDNAPDFVKASISIKREDLIEWLEDRDDEWINVDVKESRNGKWYAAVNAWKPSGDSAPRQRTPQPEQTGGFEDDDIPF